MSRTAAAMDTASLSARAARPLADAAVRGLAALRGLGRKRIAAWNAFGVVQTVDLLRWPPRRHQRFPPATAIEALARAQDGDDVSVRVRLVRKSAGGRRGIVATRLRVADPSGELDAVLFGPRWLAGSFRRREALLLRGTLRRREGRVELHVRAWLHEEELPPEGAPTATCFQPHYDLPDFVAPRLHRRCVRAALEQLRDELAQPLPAALQLVAGRFATAGELFRALHFPADEAQAAAARRVLAFEEAIAVQRRLEQVRRERPARPGGALPAAREWLRDYAAAWPEPLTGDQQRAIEEIAHDAASPRVMARVLTGDVGCGKTRVALAPLWLAARAGRQGALLAPTELLARQHHATLTRLAQGLQLEAPLLLAGGARGAARGAVIEAPWIVGTHRLLSTATRFRDLAAVVVDEQHKFGVLQRGRLFAKGAAPDVLLVSATPIPRTLAQTLFGALEVSTLRTHPFGGRRVSSETLCGARRGELGARVRAELASGGRVFVVCPAIERREGGAAGARAAAERVAPWLARETGGEAVAVLHGRLPAAERDARLADFAAGRVRLAVATVVIEVGLDVAGATMMVILDAERFGLAQLHQLRGRVGRRGQSGRCLAVSADPSPAARDRLERFCRIDDGFELARLDLELRGPGELLGRRQHGLLAGLYPESLLDPELVARARELAGAGERNSLPGSPFGASVVATPGAIW